MSKRKALSTGLYLALITAVIVFCVSDLMSQVSHPRKHRLNSVQDHYTTDLNIGEDYNLYFATGGTVIATGAVYITSTDSTHLALCDATVGCVWLYNPTAATASFLQNLQQVTNFGNITTNSIYTSNGLFASTGIWVPETIPIGFDDATRSVYVSYSGGYLDATGAAALRLIYPGGPTLIGGDTAGDNFTIVSPSLSPAITMLDGDYLILTATNGKYIYFREATNTFLSLNRSGSTYADDNTTSTGMTLDHDVTSGTGTAILCPALTAGGTCFKLDGSGTGYDLQADNWSVDGAGHATFTSIAGALSATPTLQDVTDAGNTTTNNIASDSGTSTFYAASVTTALEVGGGYTFIGATLDNAGNGYFDGEIVSQGNVFTNSFYANFYVQADNAITSYAGTSTFYAASITNSIDIGNGYDSGSGVTINPNGNLFMTGKLTVDGDIDPVNYYGSGFVAASGALYVDSEATIAGGYGSTGVTISSAGALSADSDIVSDTDIYAGDDLYATGETVIGSNPTYGTSLGWYDSAYNVHFVNDQNTGRGIKVVNTYNGAAAPATIQMQKLRVSGGVDLVGQDNDEVGAITFNSNDDSVAPVSTTYGQIQTWIDDASNGTEDGRINFVVTEAGAFTDYVILDGGDTDVNIEKALDVNAAADFESTVDIAGNLTASGTFLNFGNHFSDNFPVNITVDKSLGGAMFIRNINSGPLGPIVKLSHQSPSPQVDDKPGVIQFLGNNDALSETQIASIFVEWSDVASGSENASLYFDVMQDGTMGTALRINGASGTVDIGRDTHIEGNMSLAETATPSTPAADNAILWLDNASNNLMIMWDSGATATIATHP